MCEYTDKNYRGETVRRIGAHYHPNSKMLYTCSARRDDQIEHD